MFILPTYKVLTMELFEFTELFSETLGCVTLKSIWLKGLYFSRWSRFSFSFLSQLSNSKRLGEIRFSKDLRNYFSFASILGRLNGWSSSKTWVYCALLCFCGLQHASNWLWEGDKLFIFSVIKLIIVFFDAVLSHV